MTPGIVTVVTEPATTPSPERVDRGREIHLLARLETDIAQVDTAMGLVESGDLDAASTMVAQLAPSSDEPAVAADLSPDPHHSAHPAPAGDPNPSPDADPDPT